MPLAAQAAMLTPERSAARRWWHDRALVALVTLFVVVAPLVTSRIYASDEIQYFAYTHSLFFDGDLDFSNQYLYFYESDKVKFQAIYEDLYLKHEPETGLPINVAPIGTGLLWMPSFAAAHSFVLAASALGMDIPANGYSQPYIVAICLTSYLYGCLGLLLCYLLAKGLFGSGVAAFAVATVWLATPLVFYTVVAPPWSHATSLFTVTLFLWYWNRTRRKEGRSLREWALLGASAGLMMLVREQDALFMVVPATEAALALVGDWRAKVQALTANIRRWVIGLLLMGITAAVVFVPQLIAYRVITGGFGPSKVVSGKFTWTAPNALNVLFSPEHGLIPWTPVLVLALIGLALLWRTDRTLTLALSVAFLLQVYVAGSFLTWQSAGSFGQRRFINSTSIFVLGACALVAWALANGCPKWLIAGVAALFVAWNAGLLMQYALWCSPQRQGLDWATVLKGQVEMPGRAASLIWDYLTDRQKFYRQTRQC
ncbi:MAG TPA: glycosyltransferase family 39 protein [Chloroflexia bacterium]|nr:glycosyltransferase family 39 protein [Chloroflexia bacterium]